MAKLKKIKKGIDQKAIAEVRKSIYLTLEEQAMVEAIQKRHNIKKFNQVIRELINNYYVSIITGEHHEPGCEINPQVNHDID